jgi:hypothetical protein
VASIPLSGWTNNPSTGNGGSVLAAASDLPALKTTLSGLADGKYDIFAYFWADSTADWRIQAGLDAGNLQLFRLRGAQQAEAAQFDSPVTLAGVGAALYRAYLGRATVAGGSSIQAYIDDLASDADSRAWYDGLGYAPVSVPEPPTHILLVICAASLYRLRPRRALPRS